MCSRVAAPLPPPPDAPLGDFELEITGVISVSADRVDRALRVRPTGLLPCGGNDDSPPSRPPWALLMGDPPPLALGDIPPPLAGEDLGVPFADPLPSLLFSSLPPRGAAL